MTSTLQIYAIHRLFFMGVFCCLASLASAEPIETELPGVTAEVIELRQQSGILRLAIRLTNGTDKEAKDSGALKLADVVLVDAKTKKKHFPLRAADQHYLGGPRERLERWWSLVREYPSTKRGYPLSLL